MSSTSARLVPVALLVVLLVGLATPAWAQISSANAAPPDLLATETIGCVVPTSVQLALQGRPGAGFHFDASSLVGTIGAEVSPDGGNTWFTTEMIRLSNPFFVPRTSPERTWLLDKTTTTSDEFAAILIPGGASHVRVRTRDCTSGTVTIRLRATQARVDFGWYPPPPLFYCTFSNINPNLDKFMATLFNSSATRKVVVRRVYAFNNKAAAVAGVILEQFLMRITARTVVTNIVVDRYDLNDTLSAGIACDIGSVGVSGAGNLTSSFWVTGEEVTLAANNVSTWLQNENPRAIVYECRAGERCLTLRENQGITIKNITDSTVGTVGYRFVFTDEADTD